MIAQISGMKPDGDDGLVTMDLSVKHTVMALTEHIATSTGKKDLAFNDVNVVSKWTVVYKSQLLT